MNLSRINNKYFPYQFRDEWNGFSPGSNIRHAVDVAVKRIVSGVSKTYTVISRAFHYFGQYFDEKKNLYRFQVIITMRFARVVQSIVRGRPLGESKTRQSRNIVHLANDRCTVVGNYRQRRCVSSCRTFRPVDLTTSVWNYILHGKSSSVRQYVRLSTSTCSGCYVKTRLFCRIIINAKRFKKTKTNQSVTMRDTAAGRHWNQFRLNLIRTSIRHLGCFP